MMKQLLAAAVAAAVLVPAASAATNNVVVYGKVDMALTKADRDNGATDNGGAAGEDDWNIHENGGATKLGFKGTEDLGNGLKAIWKMEFDVPVGRQGAAVNSNRNAYVGLAGDWGTALMGRHDTPYKMAFGKWDLFADTVADFNNTNMVGFTDRRAQDAVAYVSPSMNGLSFAAAIVVGGDHTGSTTADGIAEGKSIAVNYSNNGIMAALAYENISDDLLGAADDDTLWSAALGYKGNGFFVGGRYENHNDAGGVAGADFDNWQISASYDFGNNTVKGTYGMSDNDAANTEDGYYAIGLDHNFSKRTKAYVIYTATDRDVADTDYSAFSLGMSHTF
jgi:predicted porin